MNRSDRRLLITIDRWYQEASGGARKLAGRWAEWLADSGYHVDLVCGRAPAASDPSSPRSRLTVHSYPISDAPSAALQSLRDQREATRAIVSRLAKAQPFDIHHGHIPLHFLGAHDALRKTQTRHLYTLHSPYTHELRAQWRIEGMDWKRQLALVVANQLESRVLNRAEYIHGLSSYTRTLLPRRLQRDNGKFRQIPGTVPTPRADQPSLHAYPELAKWRRNRPMFLVIRRIEGRMGLDNVLDACARLRANGRKFCLVIVGSGTRLTALRAQRNRLRLQDYVKFLGFVPDDALEEVYASASCALLPSTGLECFGLPILESHLRGLPLIATPIGAIPETIGPEEQAWITDSPDSEALAERMSQFLDGKLTFDRNRLIARAQQFTEDALFPQWEKQLLHPLLD